MLAVLAVGMGATLRLLRRPWAAMSAFRVSHAYGMDGVTPHKSYYSWPLLAGLPWKVEYAPSSLASSALVDSAAK